MDLDLLDEPVDHLVAYGRILDHEPHPRLEVTHTLSQPLPDTLHYTLDLKWRDGAGVDVLRGIGAYFGYKDLPPFVVTSSFQGNENYDPMRIAGNGQAIVLVFYGSADMKSGFPGYDPYSIEDVRQGGRSRDPLIKQISFRNFSLEEVLLILEAVEIATENDFLPQQKYD